MLYSKLIGRRYKEKPAEASFDSHALLLRGGYIRQVATGIYSLLLPAQRIVAKIERILREEMDAIGGQEIKAPVVMPRELWDESGRYDGVGAELMRMTDRFGHGLLLGMTHEEAFVHIARSETQSYKDYPFMLYQIQTKFRDEPRSRGGLIRVREFTMKDAYSFHTTWEDLEDYYVQVSKAYRKIFARIGIPETVVVESDSGMMGGKVAHEYMLLCDIGEDTVVTCDTCGYLANREVAIGLVDGHEEPEKPIEKVHTPGTKTIESLANMLNVSPSKMAKAVFYKTSSDKIVLVLVRGDIEVNEIKLAKIVKSQLTFATDNEIHSVGAVPGFASAIGLTNCIVIADNSVANTNNLITGANESDYHIYNFNLKRDAPNAQIADIAMARDGDSCQLCREHRRNGKIVLKRGIEVGNIFQLGDRYTKDMKMTYAALDNTEQTPVMGCYGIGVGRALASVAEARRDDKGMIVWPMSIAPWQVQINAINLDKPNVRETAEKLYKELTDAGLEVIFDDRNVSAGQQFAEADLLGVPLRLIVSPRNLEKGGKIEWKIRIQNQSGFMSIDEVCPTVCGWVKDALACFTCK